MEGGDCGLRCAREDCTVKGTVHPKKNHYSFTHHHHFSNQTFFPLWNTRKILKIDIEDMEVSK